MELSKIEETVFMFDGGIHMHERVMRENYAKAYKLVVILAVVLAVVSAVAIPLSLSRQIRDAAALERPMARSTTTASMTATTARMRGKARSHL